MVVNSQMVRHHFQHYYDFSREDLRVIPSSIDPARFAEPDRLRQRLEWRQQRDIGPEETVALFVAMNYRLKGLAPLLNSVAAAWPTASVSICWWPGNPRTAPYERWPGGWASRRRCISSARSATCSTCYFAADFLVHPTFYDPCSLVVLEALACGLPVITSRCNGASELHGNTAGWSGDRRSARSSAPGVVHGPDCRSGRRARPALRQRGGRRRSGLSRSTIGSCCTSSPKPRHGSERRKWAAPAPGSCWRAGSDSVLFQGFLADAVCRLLVRHPSRTRALASTGIFRATAMRATREAFPPDVRALELPDKTHQPGAQAMGNCFPRLRFGLVFWCVPKVLSASS